MAPAGTLSAQDFISFTKMHGLGNDFVLIDARHGPRRNWAALAPYLARRRLGVGCDQVLVLATGTQAEYAMEIYNADGSQVEMCGNGIRCLALYLRDRGLCSAAEIPVETLAGVVTPRFVGAQIEVDMGEPEFEGRRIPVDADGAIREVPVHLDEGAVKVTCVSMGNPHAVVFVDDVASYPVAELGPRLERHPFFPNRANVEFVQVSGPDQLHMRVWERGSGETLACGSGACAAAVASHWTGRSEREVCVQVAGGELTIRWDRDSGRVFMTGPARTVFEGRIALSALEEPA